MDTEGVFSENTKTLKHIESNCILRQNLPKNVVSRSTTPAYSAIGEF